jgi:hypothetical protein
MKDTELDSLNAWFASKADAPVDTYDYEYALEHFGELLDDAYKSREWAEQYKQDWYNAKCEFGTSMAKLAEKLREADVELTLLRRIEEVVKDILNDDGFRFESDIERLRDALNSKGG